MSSSVGGPRGFCFVEGSAFAALAPRSKSLRRMLRDSVARRPNRGPKDTTGHSQCGLVAAVWGTQHDQARPGTC